MDCVAHVDSHTSRFAPASPPSADASAWLRASLAQGPRAAADILAAAERAGISPKRLRTARERLGVTVAREGFGPGSRIVWAPAPVTTEEPSSIDALRQTGATDPRPPRTEAGIDPAALLADLEALGVMFRVEGDRLAVDAPAGVLTSEQRAALVEHKPEILGLLAAEIEAAMSVTLDEIGPIPDDAVFELVPDAERTVLAGENSDEPVVLVADIPDAELNQRSPVYLPQEAGRLLLALGSRLSYPLLPHTPGVSIAPGQMRWRAFVTWATADLLALAVEQVQREPSRRCVILGCWSPCDHGDPVFCRDHRLRADAGLLWDSYGGSDASQEAQDDTLAAPGATQAPNCTPGPPPARTDVLEPSTAPEDRVDVVIQPAPEPINSGLTFEALMARLCDRDSQMYVDSDRRLHYVGLPLAPGDPILLALSEHLVLLTEAFTYAPGRRCVFPGCLRLCGLDDTHFCPDHLDADRGGCT